MTYHLALSAHFYLLKHDAVGLCKFMVSFIVSWNSHDSISAISRDYVISNPYRNHFLRERMQHMFASENTCVYQSK